MPTTRIDSAAVIKPLAILLAALIISTSAKGQVPFPAPGYSLSIWHLGLTSSPTAITFDDQGRLYCTTYGGQVFILEDADSNGTAETSTLFFDGSTTLSPPITGIALHNGKVYVAHRGFVTTLEDTNNDMTADVVTDIITGLPFGLDHQTNGLVFDENDLLYIGQGSVTDHGPETHPYAATILRANDDGSNLIVYATGVRNAYGLEYRQGLGLIATDNGPNADLANPLPADEVDLIVQGGNYGYPLVYGNPPSGHPSKAPALELPAHSAPTDPAFDHQRAWSGFENDLIVPLFATGAGAVVRVSMFPHPSTGIIDSWFHGVAGGFSNVIATDFSPQGELMVADFTSALIYRLVPEDSARIRFNAQPRIGTFIPVELEAPDWPNHFYFFLLANSNLPGYVLQNGEVLFLDVNSPLFNYAATPGNIINVFAFPAQLDGLGQGSGHVFLPNYAPLAGFTIWAAFVTFDGILNIGSVSESVPLEILPL